MLFTNAPLFAATNLADAPVFATNTVPGNVALVISAEFPTALGSAYTSAYSSAIDYIGYFDANKCYIYHTEADIRKHYFEPSGLAAAHACVGKWSGNYLNWALTQTVDPFRYALTGGYRSIDEVGLTVLEKAWASGQGGSVVTPKITASVNRVTPYNWANARIQIAGLGNKFYISNDGLTDAGVIVTPENPILKQTDALPADATGTRVYEFFARVKVCVTAANKEANCVLYGVNYKPEGLIQKNATKLNFAAFGYLNDDNLLRDGGVLRAKMAPLGPMKSKPGFADEPNLAPEWSATTGIFLQNPNTADAAASGVNNSGVINYLNKFGLSTPGYKTYDPVGELYYTAIRYFKNQGSVASYTASATAAQLDDFPVINFTAGNSADDPIKYSCQANFVIGIGDTNTHADANLPGSNSIPTAAKEPPMPPEVSADTSVNVVTATNKVGELQGLNGFGNLGTRTTPWCCNNNTFLMTGLAYDSHTIDMRPTEFLPTVGVKTKIQTLDTYWLDVLESGDRFDSTDAGMRNQFWLTAKYGGFNVPNNYNAYAVTIANTPNQLQWDTDNNGDPDNYFRANNPAAMISGLTKTFEGILQKVSGSSKAFSVKNSTITAGDLSFASSYKGDDWSGDVIANRITTSGSTVTETPIWSAAAKLGTQAAVVGAVKGWDTGRFIATSTCVAGTLGAKTCTGVPFRPANINATMQSNLGTGYTNIVNYLRGDKSNEQVSGGTLRNRFSLMGDIVGSKVIVAGAPSAPYTDALNPGYSTFKTTYTNRSTVSYVGANDGMLHAIKGTETGGQELFAYVPNALFAGTDGVPANTGLVKLSQPAYNHRFYVDATPIVTDVNFGASSSDWHSILIGGLGKGGKSYYALDVTDPDAMSNEATLKSKVLWEFSNTNMGFTYDIPLIVKTTKFGWVAIFPSGYNNSDGIGYIFIVNIKTGALIQSISTGVGSSSNDAGLAHISAFTADSRSLLVDAVYGGDLLGNVWRFDLTGSPTTYPAPEKIATLISPSNNLPQPITTAPVIEIDQTTSKRYVFVGTGKLLASSDISDAQQQSFYAILDGTRNAFFSPATLPSAVGGYPIDRADMNNNTNSIATGIGINPPNYAGWYVDLPVVTDANGTVGYRVNVDLASSAGQVVVVANLTQGEACSPSGINQLYAFAYGTGRTTLSGGVTSLLGVGLGTSVSFYKVSGTDTVKINRSNDAGDNDSTDTSSGAVTGFKPLNWRELPGID